MRSQARPPPNVGRRRRRDQGHLSSPSTIGECTPPPSAPSPTPPLLAIPGPDPHSYTTQPRPDTSLGDEVIQQFRRMKNTAPGVDGLTYATCRWVDPKGLILAMVFNVCRLNSRVPICVETFHHHPHPQGG